MGARYTVPGPCKLSWNAIDLGYTKAGVTINVETTLIPIIDDEHGTEPVDWIRAGKSATVSCILMDAAKFKLALASVTATNWPVLFGVKNETVPVSQIGRLANDGDPLVDAAQFGNELIITERTVANLWKAKYTLMSDPQGLLLASTQELQLPIQFVVALDHDDKLFYDVPDYMRIDA